jgi:hypothetical protein
MRSWAFRASRAIDPTQLEIPCRTCTTSRTSGLAAVPAVLGHGRERAGALVRFQAALLQRTAGPAM